MYDMYSLRNCVFVYISYTKTYKIINILVWTVCDISNFFTIISIQKWRLNKYKYVLTNYESKKIICRKYIVRCIINYLYSSININVIILILSLFYSLLSTLFIIYDILSLSKY